MTTKIFSLQYLLCNRNFLTILLFSYNTFYMVLDINLVSPYKIFLMCLCPFMLIKQHSFISKPFIIALLYLTCITLCAYMHPNSFRPSTIIYTAMFMIMYVTFYTTLWQEDLDINYFIRIIEILVTAYIVIFIIQQISLAFGIRKLAIINLSGEPYLQVFKTNALSLEPSHSARILCVSFYAWLKLNEYKNGYRETIASLWHNHRYFFLGFLYIMLAMGSGTAMIALFLLSFYFINKRGLFILPIVILSLITINEYSHFESLNRSMKVATALSSTNAQQIQKADGSAYYRIAPIVNTIQKSDLTSSTFWFGNGIDSTIKNKSIELKSVMVGGIADYGFLSFIILIAFVYTSAIRRFWCLETLFFIVLTSCSLGNGYYIWGIQILFSIIKRFEYEINTK